MPRKPPNHLPPKVIAPRALPLSVTPKLSDEVLTLYLRCLTREAIAKRTRQSIFTVNRLLDEVLLPQIATRSATTLELELAKITYLERFAWEQLDAGCRESLKQALDRLSDSLADANKPQLDKHTLKSLEQAGVLIGEYDKGWVNIIQWSISTRARLQGFTEALPLMHAHQLPHNIVNSIQLTLQASPESLRVIQEQMATIYPGPS